MSTPRLFLSFDSPKGARCSIGGRNNPFAFAVKKCKAATARCTTENNLRRRVRSPLLLEASAVWKKNFSMLIEATPLPVRPLGVLVEAQHTMANKTLPHNCIHCAESKIPVDRKSAAWRTADQFQMCRTNLQNIYFINHYHHGQHRSNVEPYSVYSLNLEFFPSISKRTYMYLLDSINRPLQTSRQKR